MNPHYPLVAKRAVHRCEYCGAPEAVFNFPFEVEHVLPIIHGGSNDDSNLALSCRACNVHKGAAIQCNDPVTKTEVVLFNPRRDVGRAL
jgi:5-methylcytosine-specific restriction endonuclease McrA